MAIAIDAAVLRCIGSRPAQTGMSDVGRHRAASRLSVRAEDACHEHRRNRARSRRADGEERDAAGRPVAGHPDRPGQRRPGRIDPGRLLRLADAAEADGQPEHARAAADLDPPVRSLGHRRHRQGDPDQRPGPDAQLRRQGRPPERPRRSRSNSARSWSTASRSWPRRPASRSATSAATPTSRPTLEQTEKILTEDDLATCKEEIQTLTKQFEAKVNETGRQEVGRDHGNRARCGEMLAVLPARSS